MAGQDLLLGLLRKVVENFKCDFDGDVDAALVKMVNAFSHLDEWLKTGLGHPKDWDKKENSRWFAGYALVRKSHKGMVCLSGVLHKTEECKLIKRPRYLSVANPSKLIHVQSEIASELRKCKACWK